SHASHWVKGEKLYSPLTSKYEQPDEELMQHVEAMWEVEDADEFRRGLLGSVANWVIEHPSERVTHHQVFPRPIQQLASVYFREHEKQLAEMARDIPHVLDGQDGLLAARREVVDAAHQRMLDDYGYQ